ncbi:MAG: hypothetical protein ACYTG0_31750, partial [Planctomycetota bacterium]
MQCPECQAKYRVKQPAKEGPAAPTTPASMPASPSPTPKDGVAHEPPHPAPAPGGEDDDEYRLADEPPATRSWQARAADVAKPGGYVEPVGPLRPTPITGAARAGEEDDEQRHKDWKLMVILGGGGAVCLVCIVGIGIWLFGGGGEDSDSSNGDRREAAQTSVLDEVELREANYVVIEKPLVPARKKQKAEGLNLAPSPEAKAIAPGGSADSPGVWKAFPELTPKPAAELRPASDVPVAYNDEHYVILHSTRGDKGPSRTPVDDSLALRDVYWQKFEWKTGNSVGPPRWLGSEDVPANERPHPAPPPSLLVAALSPDGKRFSAEAIGQPGAVRVWMEDGSV